MHKTETFLPSDNDDNEPPMEQVNACDNNCVSTTDLQLW